MPQHIRRDLSFYDGNSNRQFFARTINSIGLSVKAIAGQVASLFGIYDVSDNLIAGFQSDGDVFVPNVISRYGLAGEFTLNDFYDSYITFSTTQAVLGPSSSTDNAIALFDGTTGKLIQQCLTNVPTISDSGIASFPSDSFSECERIGVGSSVSGIRATVFGANASSTQNGVAVGRFATCSGSSSTVAVGTQAQAQNFGCIAIGTSAIASGSSAINIGGQTASGAFCFVLGGGCSSTAGNSIAIGQNVDLTHKSIALGRNLNSKADFEFMVGGIFNMTRDFYLGTDGFGETTATVNADQNVHFAIINGSTDANAYDVYFKAQPGTGTGTGGHFIFQTAPASTTGSTPNAHVDVLEITDEKETKMKGAVHAPITTVSTDTTLNANHYTVLVDTSAGEVDITLPTNVDGRIYNIKKISSDVNRVNVIGTVDDGTSTFLTTQYESIKIQNETTNWWIL